MAGPPRVLAGHRLHVPGQRAHLEETAVLPGPTSGTYVTPTGSTHAHRDTQEQTHTHARARKHTQMHTQTYTNAQ